MNLDVPVTILSGFLGSGKTSLLNHLLSSDHGYKVAVIVNEFGEVGVDGQAVVGGEQFVELDNGCLCCALNEDLEQLLRDLKNRGGFDHVLIETTGMADPLPVAWGFTRPGLSSFYRVDAIVAVVDAAHIERALQETHEARVQIERADILLLNKTDLTTDDGRQAEATVRSINDLAPMLRCTHGAAPWEVLMTSDEPSRFLQQGEPHGHQHQPSYETFAVPLQGEMSEVALEDFIEQLPDQVYRMKGLVQTDAPWSWTLVNVVAGRVDMRPIEPREETPRAALVFMGLGMDESAIQQALDRAQSASA